MIRRNVFAGSTFDGQWTGEIHGTNGTQIVRLLLRTQGVKVTGTLAFGNEQENQIQEGIIEGNTRSIVRFKTNDALWTGTLKWGNTKTIDEIAFVREVGPQGGRIEFSVKRVPQDHDPHEVSMTMRRMFVFALLITAATTVRAQGQRGQGQGRFNAGDRVPGAPAGNSRPFCCDYTTRPPLFFRETFDADIPNETPITQRSITNPNVILSTCVQ